jgi:hypothetical protein
MKPLAVRGVRPGLLTVLSAATLAISLAGASSAAFAQAGPFNGLDGSWSGAGTVELADGTNERIRCRATYKVGSGGNAMEQTLRCASDSYKFDLAASVQSSGGTIAGNWSETNRNVNGTVQGRAAAGSINVLVEAAGFSANLTVATKGNKQSVGITSKGEIRNVNISMSKA